MTSQRLHPHEHLPHRVYVLRDHADTVLYIGVSSRVKTRVRSHTTSQPWRAEIDPARTVVMDEMPWEAALELEEAAIQKWQPKYNRRQHNGSAYVAAGVRALIATETRLTRAARTGDPAARAAYDQWQGEQVRVALEAMSHIDFSPIFSTQERAS